jgi:hypothetical protein
MKLVSRIVLVAIFGVCQIANAQVVTRCGASAGHEYYFAGGLVPLKKAGWTAGGISEGSTILMRAGDSFEMVFSDALGRSMSATEDGGVLVVISNTPESIALVVSYPGKSIETWIFKLDETGRGEVTFSQARYNGTLSSKHSLFRASCEKHAAPKK